MRRGAVTVHVVIGALAVALGAAGATPAAERAVAPGYRVESLVTGLPYALEAVEPFRGVLLVSVGAATPGGRLMRFVLRADAPTPLAARSGEAVLWSRTRLVPLVTYRLTGRVHAATGEAGEVLQFAGEWEPQPLVVGLPAVHDLAFRPDSRLLVAAGGRVLEGPIYIGPPLDAARLRPVHRCAGECRGVAVVGEGGMVVLEADGDAGRIVQVEGDGVARVVAGGLRQVGAGLRAGPRGDLFLSAEAGVLRIGPDGGVTVILAGFVPGRVSLDPDGQPLVTDPAAGEVLRLRLPAE